MLEDFAIQYTSQSEDHFRLIPYGLAIVGGLVAGLFHRSRDELQRAPYFVYSALIFLVTSAARLVWLGTVSALVGGYLWILMTIDMVVSLAVGYALCVIAMARSRDAAGHGRLAALAFIPLANLWLILAPSKVLVSASRVRTIPLLSGSLGVVTGFVLLIASVALVGYAKVETDRAAENAGDDPATRRAGLEAMLEIQGLEATLRLMSFGVSRQRIDDTVTLLGAKGDGKILQYSYEISTEATRLPVEVRNDLEMQVCASPDLHPIILAGATVEQVYLRPDGLELGMIKVSKQSCGLEQMQSGGG